jgi:hypothetical protein
VSSTEEVYEVMRRGSENRVVASTSKYICKTFHLALAPIIMLNCYVIRYER